jgi:Ankyrin repeats (3 copies)
MNYNYSSALHNVLNPYHHKQMLSLISCLHRRRSDVDATTFNSGSMKRNKRNENTEFSGDGGFSSSEDSSTNNDVRGHKSQRDDVPRGGEFPLHSLMSYRPPLEEVNRLITTLQDECCYDCLPEELVDTQGRTPLHLAAAEGCNISIIQRLLIRNKSVQIADEMGRYPLHYACANPRGIPSMYQNFTPSHLARNNCQNMLEVITTLIWAYPKAVAIVDIEGYTPITLAGEQKAEVKIMRLLRTHQPNNKSTKLVLVQDGNGIRSVDQSNFVKNLSKSQLQWDTYRQPKKCSPTNGQPSCQQNISNLENSETSFRDPASNNLQMSSTNSKGIDAVNNKAIGLQRNRTIPISDDVTSAKTSYSFISTGGKSAKTVRANNSMFCANKRRSTNSSKGGSSVETQDLTRSANDSQGTPSGSSNESSEMSHRQRVDTIDMELSFIHDRILLPTCFEQRSAHCKFIDSASESLQKKEELESKIFDPWNELDSLYKRAAAVESHDSHDIVLVNQLLPTILVKHGDDDDDDCSSIGLFSANMHFFLDQTRPKFGRKKSFVPDYERMEL